METTAAPQSALQQLNANGSGASPAQSTDPTPDAPQELTGEQVAAKAELDARCQAALIELRTTFKKRYQPKRMRFISESTRAFEAIRGSTFALLNDQSASLDTINQLMAGFLGQGEDPDLYAHNDNIYQTFLMIFIAALMVDLGKVRYQPADAQDDQDLEIANKASTIQAFNERKNKIASLHQLKLLYLWTCGGFFRYTRYTIDQKKAGTSLVPQYENRPTKISPDGYLCPNCGFFNKDTGLSPFSSKSVCAKCGMSLNQKDWYEGEMLDLPVKVSEIEQANGMTAFTIANGLMVDVNPDALDDPIADTEILDYTIELSAAKIRAAYPAMYAAIAASMGSDAAVDGDASKRGRSQQTTPGSNARAITTEGLCSYSRCWIDVVAFNELDDQELAKELTARYPKGCKLVLCGQDTFLDAVNEAKEDHWTWCGTIKGLGAYPFAAGKVVMDVQERVTKIVNKIEAYADRIAFGAGFFDADAIDGNALQNKIATPGNLTGVSRTDEETGQRTPMADLFHHFTFNPDPEIWKYADNLTTRAQFLCGVMPQVFGGSDKHVETAAGQEQALNTALGRLKQYIDQMRAEDADAARLSVRCSVENMDEEIKIVEPGEQEGSWKTIRILKAELNGDFFTYPESDAGFPATYQEIQARLMQLLAQNQKMPIVAQMLADPKIQRVMAQYLLPPEIKLPLDAQLSKIEKVIHRLAQDSNGPVVQPNPGGPQLPPIVVPSIIPEPNVDDPAVCHSESKQWLISNWEQAETNPKGYNNVLAYMTVSAQMEKQQAAAAALTMQAQANQGQQRGAGSGAPAQAGS
jgi:hypothetical protein